MLDDGQREAGTPRRVPPRAGLKRRRAVDLMARRAVSAGGVAAILGIAAIFFFLCREIVPLAYAPQAGVAARFQVAGAARWVALSTDEYRHGMYGVGPDGDLHAVNLANGTPLGSVPIPSLAGKTASAWAAAGRDRVVVATADGSLTALRVVHPQRSAPDSPPGLPRLLESGSWSLGTPGRSAALVAAATAGDGVTALWADDAGAAHLFSVSETKNLFDEVQRSEVRRDLTAVSGAVTALAITANGRRAFVGTADGFVELWDLAVPADPKRLDVEDASGERGVAVTALGLLIGEQALVVGDARGGVSSWFALRDTARRSGWRLQRIRSFDPHAAAVTALARSWRDKSFLSADADGSVRVHHNTTGRTLLDLPGPGGPLAALAFSPKANGGVSVGADGSVVSWFYSNPHSEVTLATLFGPVWYEGYEAPAVVWQSTGGTDDFEPKLSLVPLIFGTMKGTLYALLFAVPIAVFGALYASQFMHPSLRGVVKPLVEIMAALPSVVLGFLAGLWLAPAMERLAPAVIAALVLAPGVLFAAGAAWAVVPTRIRARLRTGSELAVVAGLIVVVAGACLGSSAAIERVLFGGDFVRWLGDVAGLRYDQRNCLVVGFAMGFAVIPIIFTISEDALSSVPRRLMSGSLALGATRWQTALRVVLPTASPGIFSAVMVGFGRAVGETMIVLMATGNTPVLDWNIFTGMRTLSANIAVEIPEAAQGGTLYRVLFLAAFLLFAATFVVNTAAELVRQRLRRRYQQL